MRAAKFRGKSRHTGEWLYGDLLTPKPADPEYYIRFADEEGDTLCWEVSPETVGQYTGLKDKNGVEIYEGDRVRFLSRPYMISQIHYSANHGAWFAGSTRFNREYAAGCEIIGHIYDNSKLLGKIGEDGEL